MKHIKTITTVALLAINFPVNAEIKMLNHIVAEVNASIVTYGDVQRNMKLLRIMGQNPNISDQQLENQVKTKLIERVVLLDAAKRQKFKITPAEIDLEIKRRAQIAHISTAELMQQTRALGWKDDAYRLEVAKDLLIEHMLTNLAESIKITDSDVQAYINKAQKEGTVIPSGNPFTVYKVRRILLNINEKDKAAAVGERMKLIAETIQNGGDFGTLARRYSQEAAAVQNGILEINENSQPEKVEAMLKILKPGETSAPISTTQNWQMIQMLEKRNEIDPIKTQREAIRHILIQKRQQQEQEKLMQQLTKEAVITTY